MPTSYHAISAKVHALWNGCRMTSEDYRQLMAKKNLSEAATFLQSHFEDTGNSWPVLILATFIVKHWKMRCELPMRKNIVAFSVLCK